MTAKKHKFVVVRADYWEALYVDGELVEQHHHVDLIDYLKQYGVDIRGIAAYNHPGLEDGVGFPDKLTEVLFDIPEPSV